MQVKFTVAIGSGGGVRVGMCRDRIAGSAMVRRSKVFNSTTKIIHSDNGVGKGGRETFQSGGPRMPPPPHTHTHFSEQSGAV